jgi:L-amino acid N-acyltransferase
MNLVRCDRRHAPAILEIFNDAILTSTALYDYKARTPEMMEAWFSAKEKGNYPVVGLESEEGVLLGFASYGAFRAWPAYKYSVEHSVYVHRDQRGRGLGKRLLGEIISVARAQQYHVMIGGIDSSNTPSIQLHLGFGFKHCASIKEAGFKFGRWLDLAFYQLILPTPDQPVDG